MAKDKAKAKAAAAVKYTITPGPQAKAHAEKRPPAARSRNSAESVRRFERPPLTGASRRWSMDVYGNVPPASPSGSGSRSGAHSPNRLYPGGIPSRPSSAAGRSAHSYGNGSAAQQNEHRHVPMPPLGYAHAPQYPTNNNDEEDDYVERDLGDFAAAHDNAIMRFSASSPSPVPPYPPPAGGNMRPPSSAGSHAGRMYGTPPPFSPLGIGAGRPPPPQAQTQMEVGSVYSSGSRGGGGAVGYGSYGFYAEAPAYTTPGGGGGYSAYGHDYATSPHPESITSGDMYNNDYGAAYPYSSEQYGYGCQQQQQQQYPASSTAAASSYPDLYSPEEAPPGMFGVSAPHHTPGARASAAMAAQQQQQRFGGDLPGFPTWSRTW